MKGKAKRIILWALGVLVGLPLAFVFTVLAWGSIADRTNGTMVSSGITRHYLLYVPKNYDRTKPSPLVISIHPAATWAAFERNISGWDDLADRHGFIVVYPNGSGAFFGGFTRGQHVWPQESDTLPRDVKFISDLIDKIENLYNIDPNRIYVNGMSNGGSMAFALSCELAERVAAVGSVAGAHIGGWECRQSKPVPTIAFHGTADKFAPYLGGKSPIAPRPFANIPEWAADVAQRNQCQANSGEIRVSAHVRRLTYGKCAEQADVVLYAIEGGGHTWPGGKPLPEWIAGTTTDEINGTELMWSFYEQHPRGAE